jgi:hypothetical protein
MSRYQARSEVDAMLARAFHSVGETDSATVYERYVRAARRPDR